jgi:aspartokinase
MITVPEATKKIIERSRYLSEAMSKELINLSSLARYIKPELEDMLMKKISTASIIMALKRLEPYFKPKFKHTDIFKTPPEMIVRSNLVELTVNNSNTLSRKFPKILSSYNTNKYFFTFTESMSETTIIASNDLQKQLKEILSEEKIIAELKNLSSITIRLPKENVTTPGVYYFFLKSLAWEGINIIEIVSTYLEITIILEDKEVNRAFAVLKSLFVI